MGSVTFNDSYYVANVGQSEQNVRISYSESYSTATNKTTVTFTKCEIAASRMLTNCSVRGQVQFSGTTVQDYPLNSTSYQIYIGSGGVNSYVTVPGSGGGNITVTHSSAGTASFTIKLVAVESVLDAGVKHFGAAVDGHVYGIADGTSKTVSLTTHTSTLTVNPNGGTWNGSTSSQNFVQAPTSTKTIANPTRTGYTFGGWTLSGGGSISNGVYTFGGSNGTLTAKWTINSYTVSLTAGNHIASVSGGGNKTYNSSVTATAVLASATGYTYAFDGWYQNGAKVSSNLSYTFTMPASAVALTAVGTRSANTYSVKFDPNGGTGTMANESFTYDVEKALTTNAFTRTGYTFLGWSTSSSATSATYTNGQKVKNLAASGTITLYAVWQLNTYQLSISQTKSTVVVNRTSSPLGGGSTGNLGNGATLYYNDVLKITFTANTGYTMSVHTVNGSSFSSGASHTVVGAVAVVSTAAANTYSVVFNANRGTGTGSGTMDNQSFAYDQEKALTANDYTRQILVTFNYAGGAGTPASSPAVSSFNGWATSATGAVVYSNGQKVSNLTATQNGTVTLYAKWTNGNVTLPTPTRTGYAFKGWYTAATGGTRVGGAGAKYSPTAPITLYAQWTLLVFTLNMTTSDNGLVVNVLRTASPIGGAPNGLLNNGATLYHNDVLTASFTVSHGYMLETATVNGVDFSSAGTYTFTVTQDAVVTVEVDVGGIVYIGNGTTWEPYQVFIGDGRNWNQYQAYIGNGSSWEAY